MQRQRGFTLVEGLIALAIAGVLAALFWEIFRPKDTISLDADKWSCDQEDTVRGVRPQYVGKTVIMIPTATKQCVQWRRLGRED